MGEKELETSQNFSKFGRVNYMLERRILLLEEVQKLSDSLQVNIYPEFTCETAQILYKYHIESRWQEYVDTVLATIVPEKVVKETKRKKSSAKKEDVVAPTEPAVINNDVSLKFPFLKYLKICKFLNKTENEESNLEEEMSDEALAKQFFDLKDVEGDVERAKLYWQIIHNVFKELEECRGF